MTYGYIYCFSDPTRPNLLKIGMTERTPEDRVKELYNTSTPLPFEIKFAKKSMNQKKRTHITHLAVSIHGTY